MPQPEGAEAYVAVQPGGLAHPATRIIEAEYDGSILPHPASLTHFMGRVLCWCGLGRRWATA